MPKKTAVGLLLALAAALVVPFLLPAGLSPEAKRLSSVWAASVVLWITEALPLAVTALLAPSLAVLFGVAPVRDTFAPFGDPVLFLLVGSFFVARAFETSGLGQRVALFLLTRPGIAGRPRRILPVYGLLCFAISMWTSNTATTALMYPIGLSILAALDDPGASAEAGRGASRYATCLLLLCAFGASVGGLATPVGTPPNLIGLGIVERTVGHRPTFLEWMAVALPLSLVLHLVMTGVFLIAIRKDPLAAPRPTPGLAHEREALGPWSARQKSVAAIFGFTVLLWLLPGVWSLVAGASAPSTKLVTSILPESVVALLGASLLFIVPAGGRPTLTWEEAYDIDWSTIILFGGGICLGGLLLSTGLAEGVARWLQVAAGVHTPASVVALVVVLAVAISETSSNTASATLIVPIAVALATAAGVDPVAPALAATFASSLGFMLPVSTGPNAIVFGSGRIRVRDMARYGLALDVAGVILLVVVAAIFLK